MKNPASRAGLSDPYLHLAVLLTTLLAALLTTLLLLAGLLLTTLLATLLPTLLLLAGLLIRILIHLFLSNIGSKRHSIRAPWRNVTRSGSK